MPKYRVTAPDGQTYEITAPDGASDQDVLNFVQQQSAPSPPAAQEAAPAGERPDALTRAAGFVRGLTDQANQGLFANFEDEMQAGVRYGADRVTDALGLRDARYPSYSDALANVRGEQKAFRAENPVASTVANVVGALPTALMPLGGLSRAAQAGGLGTRVAGGGAIGAGQGALYGYGAGEGVADRLTSGAIGASLGGAVGALAPAGMAAGRSLAERLLTGRAATSVGLSKPAYNTLTRAMNADDSFTGPGAARLARAGDDAMLADAGPNALGLMDTAVQRSGPAGTVARNAIEGRVNAAGQRITQALDDALGAPQGLRSVETGIRTGSAPARQAAYNAAYAMPINYADDTGRQIEGIIRSRVPPEAIRAANKLMRVEGHESAQIMASIADDGSVTFTRMPDVRQIDYLTRGLNEVADQADGMGKLGGTTQTGRAYSNLSRELRTLTRQAVPEYGVALDTAAQPIAARNALRTGQDALSARVTRDELAESLHGMSAAERDYVAQGVRSQIDDTLANVRRAMTDANMDAREAMTALRNLSSRAAREKIEVVIGPQQAARMFDELDRAATAFELRAGVAANSRTFARTSIDDAVKAQTDDGVINAVRSGQPINATRRLAQTLMGRTEADKARIGDQTYSELVRFLTESRGPLAQRTLQQLQQSTQRIPLDAQKTGRLVQMLLQRNAPVTSPARSMLYE